MSKIWLIIISFGVLCSVHSGHGESVQNYDFPRLMGSIGERMSTYETLKKASSSPDALPILDKFKNFSMKNVTQILKTLLMMMPEGQCKQDIEYLTTNMTKEKTMLAIKMLDAFGKPGSGFLEANVKWLGSYQECANVYVPIDDNSTAGGFNGQYCSLDLSVAVFNQSIPLTVGICIPDSCESQLTFILKILKLLNPMKSSFAVTKQTCQPVLKELTSAAIGMIVLLSFFILLAVIGSSMTVYEYFSKLTPSEDFACSLDGAYAETKKDGSQSDVRLLLNRNQNTVLDNVIKFFKCFCVFSNGEKLLNTDGTEGQLLCLHGIRFLSMSWVIVCHTYAFCFSAVGNFAETGDLINSWRFQIILNGFYSVDSFFLLSGFLVAYLFFQESARNNGKFPWIYFYVHRYIRLTPVYMLTIGAFASFFYYLGSGPLYTIDPIEAICKDNWWYNILYINNFVGQDKQCLGWSWYLANDMQFFVISPLFLITLYRWPAVGFAMLELFLCAAFASNFGITYHYDLFSGLGNISSLISDMPTFLAKFGEFFDKIYIKPYCRISPYLVGIALAYYLFRRKQNNQGKVHWGVLVGGWIVASAITLTCLFCLYNRTLTTVESSFYNALNRTCFAGGLAWVIFVCLNGQGGPVNSILSFKLFIPLSRLTYCAYLIHPIFLTGYFGALKAPLHFTHMTMVTLYLGLLVLTYAGAFIVSVLFESPIIKLDKLVRSLF